ncbi:immunoglobulin lambda-1 light chain-like isoform X2 [Silurus asotus]|nr:immunoglobulin lambda-1 light chain-like isoform X2 [Silurus asotus]
MSPINNVEDIRREFNCLYPAGPTVKPSVSLLPPSSLQPSDRSASLLCLLSAYSPQGALVSWTVDGSEVKDGVLTSPEEHKKDGYTRSSTLTLSKELWEKGEESVLHTQQHPDPQQRTVGKGGGVCLYRLPWWCPSSAHVQKEPVLRPTAPR